MEYEKPQVGTGVYIWKDGKVLLGKRLGTGAGKWCPPGGKLEMNELAIEGAKREVLEETGLVLKSFRFVGYTDDVADASDSTHFITLHYSSDWIAGEPKVTEPDKFETWEWFEWNALPSPLFRPVVNFIKSGFNPK